MLISIKFGINEESEKDFSNLKTKVYQKTVLFFPCHGLHSKFIIMALD